MWAWGWKTIMINLDACFLPSRSIWDKRWFSKAINAAAPFAFTSCPTLFRPMTSFMKAPYRPPRWWLTRPPRPAPNPAGCRPGWRSGRKWIFVEFEARICAPTRLTDGDRCRWTPSFRQLPYNSSKKGCNIASQWPKTLYKKKDSWSHTCNRLCSLDAQNSSGLISELPM